MRSTCPSKKLTRRRIVRTDLKTDRVENADAVRLYRRLDMIEVDWEG